MLSLFNGPAGSKFSKVGIEITDSIYVVLNMRIMTRIGKVALDHLGDSNDFVRGYILRVKLILISVTFATS